MLGMLRMITRTYSDALQGAARPAANVFLCTGLVLATVTLLVMETLVIPFRHVAIFVAVASAGSGIWLAWRALAAPPLAAEGWLAVRARSLLGSSLDAISKRASAQSIFLYYCGVVAAVLGYCYFGLIDPAVVIGGDAVIRWGFLNKRPLVFAYIGFLCFISLHRFIVDYILAPPADRVVGGNGRAIATGVPRFSLARALMSVLGASAIAFFAYCLYALPLLTPLSETYQTNIAPFF
jgi:hypothetical protein